jgi:hypothetical protein
MKKNVKRVAFLLIILLLSLLWAYWSYSPDKDIFLLVKNLLLPVGISIMSVYAIVEEIINISALIYKQNFLSEEEKNKEKIIDTSFLQVPKIKKSKTQGK